MKHILKPLIITIILLSSVILLPAQSPPHPNGGNAPGGSNTPVGAGAPVGNGNFILLALVAAYTIRKVRSNRTTAVEEAE